MDFLGSVLHDVMDKSLQGLQNQQVAIQQNLSNLDTPGYKRKKFEFDKYMKLEKDKINERQKVQRFNLRTTNPKHIQGGFVKKFPTIKRMVYDKDPTLWTDNTGNNINLDRENIAMSKNNIHSTAVINMYQKYSQTYKDAINSLAK